jgi:hypothetical protein
MKQVHIIFVISMSFLGLNAMSDVPDVTKWQEICKDPQEKQKLVTVYKDFCGKRFGKAFLWAGAGWTSCAAVYAYRQSFACPPKTIVSGSLAYVFALSQTYLLGRHYYRVCLADQGDLYYLNRDVLRQLGNPKVHGYELKNVNDIERALSGKHPE